MKKRNLLQRFIIILVVTLVGLYLVIGPHRRPRLSDFTLNGLKQTLQDNIRLGLDLKGGVHLVMRVKVEEYLKTLAQNNANIALKAAQDVGAKVTNQDVGTNIAGGTYSFYVKTADGAKLNELQDEVNKKVGTRDWTPSVSGNTVTWTLTGAAARALSQEATEQAYNTIERRINEFGVAEPTLQYHGAQGSNEILLQMPGERDPERVKQQLTGASILELVHVVSPPSPTPVQTYNSRKEGVDSLGGGPVPANRDVLPYIKQYVIVQRPDQNHIFNTETDALNALGGTASATRRAVPYPLWVVVPKPDHVFNSEKEAIASLGGTVPANQLVLPDVEKWAVVQRPDQSHIFNTEKEATDSISGAAPGTQKVFQYTGWAAIEKPDDKHTFETEKAATDSLGGMVSGDQQVLAFPDWVVIEKPSIIQGKDLSRADASQQQGGGENGYVINFNLKPDGAEKFGEWTGNNINQYMGAVLDGKVRSIAFIKGQIFDSGQISGNFTKDSAEDLARTLRSGSLLAPIEYQEERTVGPSLGADSIRSGVIASLVGLGLVIAFMLFYYRGSGINAVVALLLNMVLMIAALVLIKATLTLPGIAGIILTIGMAVDSNVLIFERIREEMRTGKTIPSAVEQGFARAFVTIIDTHVTTTVSSLFLFVFGTGPIKGFAVTLVLGLMVNLFSAVYVSRTIFIWHLNQKGKRVDSLSI